MEKKEGTLKFIENYERLFDEGYDTREIARIFGISPYYAYKLVTVVAQNLGVSRDSLLRVPHSKHAVPRTNTTRISRVEVDNLDTISQKLAEAKERIDRMLNTLNIL